VWRPDADDLSASFTTFGPKVDYPVRGPNNIDVVLYYNYRVPGYEELSECPQQGGDIIEMKPCCRFIQKKQQTLAFPQGFSRTDKMSGELETLRFTTAQSRDRLAEGNIVETHCSERLKCL
jgi:hypothetical protein